MQHPAVKHIFSNFTLQVDINSKSESAQGRVSNICCSPRYTTYNQYTILIYEALRNTRNTNGHCGHNVPNVPACSYISRAVHSEKSMNECGLSRLSLQSFPCTHMSLLARTHTCCIRTPALSRKCRWKGGVRRHQF